jgi:hypothetical protein
MDNLADLEVLLRSRHPVLLAPNRDEERLLRIVRAAANRLGTSVWTWSVTRGLVRDGKDPVYGTQDIRAALEFVAAVPPRAVFVFADAEPHLADPAAIRLLKEVAAALPVGSTVLLAGSTTTAPNDLGGLAHTWQLRPPDTEELRELTARTLRDLDARGFRMAVRPQDFDAMVRTLGGLSAREAERLIQRIALEDGQIDGADLARLRAAKAELLADDGVLELVESDAGTLDEVGGFDRLKEWLAVRRAAMESGGADLGLAPPRGILLTGVPGCGKSLVAKTLARTWQVPLVLLDPARIYGKYLGESEQRLERAVETADAMAPAVLWIDEIEKGFSGSRDQDGGAARRVLGSFLRWMQERTSDVFLVATANDVTILPPEFIRKGRFDEVFFVDLPNAEQRAAITAIQLQRRNLASASFDLEELAAATAGFSGAEIETVIVSSLYRTVADGAALRQSALLDEMATVVPLSAARAEEVARLRAWAATRAVPAS